MRIVVLLPLVLSLVVSQKPPYNEGLARQLLNLAAAAYGTNYDGCINLSFPANEQRYVYSSTHQECDILDSSCQGFIVNSNVTREVIFVFRGTKTKSQLLLEGWDSYHKGDDFLGMGRVNKYFLNAHNKLWQSILDFFSHPEFSNYRVTVTGHSLGAALASLAAAHIVRTGIRPGNAVTLYTFGQPRTGSYNYSMAFDAMGINSYRLVYRTDIVPHQPPCAKDPRFPSSNQDSRPCWPDPSNEAYHHGTEVWYPETMTPGSQYMVCNGQPIDEDQTCSDQLTFQLDNTDAYVWDHRHYFNVLVTGYGKSGCTNTTVVPPKKSDGVSIAAKAANLWSKIRGTLRG